jgi:VCBS repeat-containing protein
MKRLALVFAMLMMSAVFVQGQAKPQLSGKWAFDAEKSGTKNGPPLMTIEQTDKDFRVTMGDGTRTETVAFKLDGTETELSHGGKGRVAWKGTKLEATIISERGPSSVLFSREGEWLVQEGTSARGAMKLYFKKAPAK